jgi:hypothetical protein
LSLLASAEAFANVTEFIYADNGCTELRSSVSTVSGSCVEITSAQMKLFFSDSEINEYGLKSQGFSLFTRTTRRGSSSYFVYCFSSTPMACGELLEYAQTFFRNAMGGETIENLRRTQLKPPSTTWSYSVHEGFCGLLGPVNQQTGDLGGCKPADESLEPRSCLLDNCHVVVNTDFDLSDTAYSRAMGDHPCLCLGSYRLYLFCGPCLRQRLPCRVRETTRTRRRRGGCSC